MQTEDEQLYVMNLMERFHYLTSPTSEKYQITLSTKCTYFLGGCMHSIPYSALSQLTIYPHTTQSWMPLETLNLVRKTISLRKNLQWRNAVV